MLNFIRTKIFFLEHFRPRGCTCGQLPCLLDQKNVLQKKGTNMAAVLGHQYDETREILVRYLLKCYVCVIPISQVLCCAGTSPEIKGLLRYSDTYPLAQAHIYDSSRGTKNASFPVLRHTFLHLPTSRNLGADHHTLPNGKISY